MKKFSKWLILLFSLVLVVSLTVLPAFAAEDDPTPDVSGAEPLAEQVSNVSNGVYQSFYSLLHTHIYGGSDLTPEMTLTLVQVSTFFTLVFIFIPFVPFFWLLKRWF